MNNTPPPPPPPQAYQRSLEFKKIDKNLKLFSNLNLLLSGISLFSAGFLFLSYQIMNFMFSNKEMMRSNSNDSSFDPAQLLEVFKWFYIIIGIAALASAIINVISAILLKKRRNRSLCMFISYINCTFVPFGTALGVLTILNLQKDKVNELFDLENQ